ncbi:hypothetical protein R50072_02950 [Simiduia litorea]
MLRLVLLVASILGSSVVSANNYVRGQITSLLGSGADPAVRVGANLVPSACNGGSYGWLHFYGTPQERQWIYTTALAMSVAGKVVTVYTNSDGARCEITNIQVTDGLN